MTTGVLAGIALWAVGMTLIGLFLRRAPRAGRTED
jgi:hypothetical protein